MAVRFFIASPTPHGFRCCMPAAGRKAVCLIRGGPMSSREWMQRFAAENPQAEQFLCSLLPQTVDAVETERLILLRDTPPHTGRSGNPLQKTVDLSCFCSPFTAEDAAAWERLAACRAAAEERACRFLASAGILLAERMRTAMPAVLYAKLTAFCARLARRLFPAPSGQMGKAKERFLSAVTPDGVIFLEETVRTLCDTVWRIEDEQGAASRLILEQLCAHAVTAGLDVIRCFCPLSPFEKCEHLLIPSLRLAFVTRTPQHDFADAQKVIRCHRFIDADALRPQRNRLRFIAHAVPALVEQAVLALREGRSVYEEAAALCGEPDPVVYAEELSRITQMMV